MRFFVSYSRRDAARISPLAKRLSQLGHEAWMDERISGGQAWWDEILANIRGADAFLFAVSEASLESEACALERGYAKSLGKPVLPVMVGAVPPQLLPPDLAATQFVDYSTPGEDAAIQLAGALGRMPAAPALPDPLPAPPPIPVSYLSDLSQKVAAQSLALDEQRSLVANLEAALRRSRMQQDPGDHAAAHDLLRKLEQRSDLYAETERRITEVMAAEASVEKSIPQPNPESSSPMGSSFPPVPSSAAPSVGYPTIPRGEASTSPGLDLTAPGNGPAHAGRRFPVAMAVGVGVVALAALAGAFALLGGSASGTSPAPDLATVTSSPSPDPAVAALTSPPEPTPEAAPTSVPWPGAPGDPGPIEDTFATTAAEVMTWIPDSIRSSCRLLDETEHDPAVPVASTEITCDPGTLEGAESGLVGSEVDYFFFPSETEARLAYETVLGFYGVGYDTEKECPESPAELRWSFDTSPDTGGGRVLCMEGQGQSQIYSTQFGHPVVIELVRNEVDMAAAYDLWLNPSLDLEIPR